jgi:hypothetical protein
MNPKCTTKFIAWPFHFTDACLKWLINLKFINLK